MSWVILYWLQAAPLWVIVGLCLWALVGYSIWQMIKWIKFKCAK